MPLPAPTKGESRTSFVVRTIRKLIDEGRPRKQAIAIALEQARKYGFEVGKPK